MKTQSMLLLTWAVYLSVIQPNWADDPPGWTPNPNGTDGIFSWSMDFGRSDLYSARIQASTRAVLLANPGWASNEMALTDLNETYNASVYTYTPDGGVGHIPAVQFFASDGAFLGTIGAVGPSEITDPNDIWVQKQFSFRPADFPAFLTATAMRLIVVQDIEDTQGVVTTVFFDDVELRAVGSGNPGPNLAPNPYFALGATPLGTDVVVPLFDEAGADAQVTVTFTEVTDPGVTTLETGNEGPEPPPDTAACTDPVYYEVSTTADSSGTIELEFQYDPVECDNEEPPKEQNLAIFHFDGLSQQGDAQYTMLSTQLRTIDDLATTVVRNMASLFAIFQRLLVNVAIDIKPGSDPNSINPLSGGFVGVAVLSTSAAGGDAVDFDATQVDPATLTFGPAGAALARAAKVRDVDGDGDVDLILHFKTADIGISCGDTDATLTGETYSGTIIEGTDSLITRNCD